MSNRNSSEDTVGWMIFAAVAMVGIFLFFLAGLLSFVLTCVSFWAWNEERQFMGQTIKPHEARGFVVAGAIGAAVMFLFGVMLSANRMLDEELGGWMIAAGYVIGSLGYAAVLGAQQEEEKKRLEREAEERRFYQMHQRPPVRTHEEPARNFDYASWDDEGPRH